jgi:hypothetical protein
LLTKEFKAKAELFQLEIKLNRLRKAKFSSEIQESISENEEQELGAVAASTRRKD